MPTSARSLADALFSKVQQRVLALLFGHPDQTFYNSEIIKKIQSGSGAVQRELARLQNSNLVSVEKIGTQKHYRVNKQSPIYHELQGIIRKTIGVAEPIREALIPYSDQIKLAFIYGSIAKGNDTARSDIDLMIVSNRLSYSDFFEAIEKVQNAVGRKINPTLLSAGDWRRKVSDRGSVIQKISASPKIFIFGSDKDLDHGKTGTRQSR
ncbi:MAG TPA: nucleotidyltransferase domain-containing protein [Pseudolabrys sp.]|jgi:predicted nucleotidyltransferase|nr:nucleotidyltransferase domain-containing protein [Pseudolabrys sp.]